jgi:hypothetical protein
MTDRINHVWRRAMAGETFHLPLMTYRPLGLQPTHDLPSQGMSTLVVYRTRNMTSRAETQATKGRGRHGTEEVIMVPEPHARWA